MATFIPLSEYKRQQQNREPVQQGDQFDNLSEKDEQQLIAGGLPGRLPFSDNNPTGIESVLEDIIGMGVRGVESAIGTPGSLLQGVSSLGNLATEKLTGYRPFPEEIPGIPTVESLREGTKRMGPAFEPKSKLGEIGQEAVTDVVSLLHPIGGAVPLKRALIASGFGNLAKYGSKEIGLGEGAQEGIKLGIMLLTSFIGKPSMIKKAAKKYEVAEKLIPRDQNILVRPYQKVFKEMEEYAGKIKTEIPSKKFIQQRISEQLPRFDKKTGLMSTENAYNTIKEMNELFLEGKVPKNAEAFMGKAIKSLADSMNNSPILKKNNPEFLKSFKEGREMYRTLRTSSKLNDFIQTVVKPISNKFVNPVTMLITSQLTGLSPTIPLIAAGAKGVGIMANFADKAIRSPAIRKEYFNMVKAAGKENSKAVLHWANKMDKTLEKEFPGGEGLLTNQETTRKLIPLSEYRARQKNIQ